MNIKNFVMAAGMVLAFFCHAESFIIPKSGQQKSMALLKEQCSDLLLEALSLSPTTISSVAHVQEASLALLPALFDDSFFATKKKNAVEKISKDFTVFLERQKHINTLLTQQEQFLQSLMPQH